MASYRYERDIRPEDLIPDQPPQLTPAQRRANWWHYHWYYVALLLCAALAAAPTCGIWPPAWSRTTPSPSSAAFRPRRLCWTRWKKN